MKKWNMIFDVARCSSCNNCVLATKDEYLDNAFDGYTEAAPTNGVLWLDLKRHERGAHPMIDVSHYIETCHQCEDAPCIRNDPTGAISQRQDGIVVIDPHRAKGNKTLVEACPYGQIHWNETRQTAQKWSFDAHLLDNGWKEPRCVQVCPTEALTLVKEDEETFTTRIDAESLVTLRHDSKGGARIWYKNFDRVTTAFLGGSVISLNGDEEQCCENIRVDLLLEGKHLASERTDVFGDFKFEKLAGLGESYELNFVDEHNRLLASINAVLNSSTYIGEVQVSLPQ